ncbi:hypothetical protein MLD38_017516 [Melastoma candidum]|uniref:Uncharacterized protein n=1 Tax=Melastoma candidum TaxID=119954 RepID=A0ACB9QS02_9MYRT|nr:hypothetical protein MLD38_017516 [Melastoma candidum]
MSTAPEGSTSDRRHAPPTGPESAAAVVGNGTVVIPSPSKASHRLRLNPSSDHDPESYDDLQNQVEFSPMLLSSLEKYLPPQLLSLPRDSKANYMRDILLRYSPEGERTRVLKHRDYRQRILASYKPLNRELYTLHPPSFFVPSFLEAIKENTAESFRRIMTEPSPGIYVFKMFQRSTCQTLLSEVENFERWVHDANFRIMRPNTMNKYGAVLDDFGMEGMLSRMMDDFVRPIAKVLFPEVGGSTLDSHHGFVVEYGIDRDVELGFHVDDSEVTLNVCLGEQFSGGELFFRGVRCDKHINSEAQSEEILDYCHVPGYAVLHRGRHRHGARATTSGRRVNLILWCRSSVFKEMKKYQTDFSRWCGECQRTKRARHKLSIATTKLELMKRERKVAS